VTVMSRAERAAALSVAAHRIASGAETYREPLGAGRTWPDLAGAVARAAPHPGERLALAVAALEALGEPIPLQIDRSVGGRDPLPLLLAALTRWTLRPHDHDPERLRRDDPALIAECLRGGTS